MECGSSTKRTIAAETGTARATALDVILPVHSQDNGTRGPADRGTKHAESMKLIKLFKLAGKAERPSVQRF